MEPIFTIKKDSLHRWQAFVPDLLPRLHDYSQILNEAEMTRALQFRFDRHRERFIIARALLRHILCLYSRISPEDIQFESGEHGKPRLKHPSLSLKFNMSHSEDWVVYILSNHDEVGIDIEKSEPHFNEAVAKRFFSKTEYKSLLSLPEAEKSRAFYRLWTGREAITKMSGKGLYSTLPDFSLDLFNEIQTVKWRHQDKVQSCHLQYFSVDPAYQSAFATRQVVKEIVSRQWTLPGLFF